MVYCFVHQLSYNDTIKETSIDISEDGTHLLATSIETVSDYKNYCREVCYRVVCDESMPQIGGPGKIVEIDESKFGKRKNHKGHNIEGQWVFGGIFHTDGIFFLQPVPSRDKDTLIPIIVMY